jgi:hypothetical protein
MAEAIPLSATLSVERVAVVVGNILGEGLVTMLEGFATERGFLRHIERKTVESLAKFHCSISRLSFYILQSYHLSREYLLSRGLDSLWSQKVQPSQLFQYR